MKAQEIRLKLGLGDSDFDFYRCHRCQRLITRVEEINAFSKKSKHPGDICKCGSPKYSPSNPFWYEYFLPRVWRFAILRIARIA